jgi:hypothetical protein
MKKLGVEYAIEDYNLKQIFNLIRKVLRKEVKYLKSFFYINLDQIHAINMLYNYLLKLLTAIKLISKYYTITNTYSILSVM